MKPRQYSITGHRIPTSSNIWNFTWPKLPLGFNTPLEIIYGSACHVFEPTKSSSVSLTRIHSCSWVKLPRDAFSWSVFWAGCSLSTTHQTICHTGRLLGSRCPDNIVSYHRLGKKKGAWGCRRSNLSNLFNSVLGAFGGNVGRYITEKRKVPGCNYWVPAKIYFLRLFLQIWGISHNLMAKTTSQRAHMRVNPQSSQLRSKCCCR